MAPKRKPHVEILVPASPSEEEETDSGSEEEEEEEEGEENQVEDESGSEEEEEGEEEEANMSTPAPPPQSKTQTQKQRLRKPETEPRSESDESASESDANPEYTIKPVVSKPIEHAKSKAKVPTSPPLAKQPPARKRGAQVEAAAKESKRSKKEVAQPESELPDDETKTNLFQRIWSDADEINLLEGLIRFKEENGVSDSNLPKSMDLFLKFIKKSLHFDVSISQLKDKLWRLRKKYLKGRGKTSQKPHERQVHDLCQRVWRDLVENSAPHSNGNVGQSSSKKGKAKAKVEASKMDAKAKVEPSKMDLDVDVDVGSGPNQVVGKADLNVLSWAEMEDFVMKRGLEFAEIEEKTQIEERWKNLHMKGLQLFVEKTDLLSKQAKIALAAYQAGKY
ncbi:hypothetical protein Tsubulata_016365 [Turnera subulata]|uniref:Glabrous enhancer-binding protein-like DBD domain-containing protein n=1 Tax=Turnera subulata TaxID=218843 RepID=A0A9Q0G412_9ROSI|nr:hypothetical protein Tsubulata_016365 [Turnera subulata]